MTSPKRRNKKHGTAINTINAVFARQDFLGDLFAEVLEYAGQDEQRFLEARTCISQLRADLARVSAIFFPDLRHTIADVDTEIEKAYMKILKAKNPDAYRRMCRTMGVEDPIEPPAPKYFKPQRSAEQIARDWRRAYGMEE
jgi:hypothetical protein